jgi:sulfhydrogenase subunit alpha
MKKANTKRNSRNRDVRIDVRYLTRVEGHGDISVDIRGGELKQCRFAVIESPRFFETMLAGRLVYEAQHLSSRICGICACGHTLASLKASESALGITPPPAVIPLRKLLLYSEVMDSHLLHFYMLAAPDFLGVPSIMPLVRMKPALVERAFRMKRLSDWTGEVLAGRHVHPITFAIGGLTRVPERARLEELHAAMAAARRDFDDTVELFGRLRVPAFERKTQYVALAAPGEYALYEGAIQADGRPPVAPADYLELIREETRGFSSAKFAYAAGAPYMVGALARFNLSGDRLHRRARKAAAHLGLKRPCHNPFMNTIAQVVEWGHCLESSIALLQEILATGIDAEELLVTAYPARDRWPVRTRAGRGVGIVEVPRGMLIHDYTVGGDGVLTAANCVIPTNQNVANIQEDMKKIVPEIHPRQDRRQMTRTLEMLVRAYDPCISCSSHLLDVRFV